MRPYVMPVLVMALVVLVVGYLAQRAGRQHTPEAPASTAVSRPAETSPRTTWADRDNTAAASVASMAFVREQLKTPRSAKFPGMFEHAKNTTRIGQQSYKVVSWVDSQNAFGAMVRTRYYMELTQTGPDDWRLDQFHVLE